MKIEDKLNGLDRKTAWPFSPWLPIVAAIVLFFVVALIGDFWGTPTRRAPVLGLGGAITACCGVVAVVRRFIRVGGYNAWYEQSKSVGGGSLKPTAEELAEEQEGRKDVLSEAVVGTALIIVGTLVNGASGFF